MSNKEGLYAAIATDLKLKKFDGESQYDFHNRLVYSAIGYWVLTLFKDRSNNEEDRISKAHITISALNILKSYIKVDSELELYFTNPGKFINEIENVYSTLGFIYSSKYSYKDMHTYTRVKISNDYCLRIKNYNTHPEMLGLGTIRKSNDKCITMDEFFKVKITAKEVFERILKNLSFSIFDSSLYGKIEVYNIDKGRWDFYSESYISKYEYSFFKIDEGLNYAILYRGDKSKYFVAKLPLIYTKQVHDDNFKWEVWRILFGLAAHNKRPLRCIKKKEYEGAYIYRFFGYVLPNEEMAFVKCIAWPIGVACNDGTNNVYGYLVPEKYTGCMDSIFKRLNIELVEG